MKSPYRLTVLLGLALLSACGGGGGGSSSTTPTPTTYTIGGSISGLTAGSGAVLLNNGGDALTVSANATSFTFSTAVAAGSSYDVTLQGPPTGETCNVNGARGTASGNVTSVIISCASNFAGGGSNIAAISVNSGPGSTTACNGSCQTFNIPLVTVTVCEPSNPNVCATIPDVMVDTGSSGLRLMASVVASVNSSLALPAATEGGNSVYECFPFADGYTWGAVEYANVTVQGETTSGTTGVPVQIIDDNSTGPSAPNNQSGPTCVSGTSMNSLNAFDANGVLGVGVFSQDCGPATNSCATSANGVYWTCPGGTCSSIALDTSEQVANPVASFPKDNNGVILQLPAIAATGAATASGYLVFGIGTETNNGLSGATVLTTNNAGELSTTFNSQQPIPGLIDSGSNALYFPNTTNPVLGTCPDASEFYCPTANPPSSPLALSASNTGQNGTTGNVAFQIVDLDDLEANYSNNFALDDVAGIATATQTLTSYFDFGLPFFYGRTVFVAIDGQTPAAGNPAGPYYAY